VRHLLQAFPVLGEGWGRSGACGAGMATPNSVGMFLNREDCPRSPFWRAGFQIGRALLVCGKSLIDHTWRRR
jgi:hypothetical protein